MKQRKKSVARFIVLYLFLFYNGAYAFPFKETPQSFQAWMNTQRWRDGHKRIFDGFYDCKFYSNRPDLSQRYGGSPGDRVELAECWYQGYVTTYSPMGKQVCELTYTSYSRNMTKMSPPNFNHTLRRCAYR